MYSEKPKVNDQHADKLDDSHKLLTLGVDEMELRNTLLHYDHEHKQKLELGEAVHDIIRNDEFNLDSLIPEHKEALDLYMKKSVKLFPENIEFKPWQISVLEEVEIPTERKIIWVVGKSCGEGKTWLQIHINYKYGDRRVMSGIS